MKAPFLLVCAAALTLGCSRRDPSQPGQRGRMLIQNKGSDTLVYVAQAWAEAYRDIEPQVAVAVTGGGSGTGISSMINGTVDLANATRAMKDTEIERAQSRGIEPLQHVVGFDAVAVFVHEDNPVEGLTLAQLAGIYGEGGTTDTWSALGISVPGCASDEIVRVSRQNNSGTYAYFKEAVLGPGRDYRLGSRDMHGSKDVVAVVARTPCAIGYSGLAYATHEVKMPCLIKAEGEACVAPSVATAVDKSYPIARPLFVYTNGEATGALKAYLDWIKSDAAQCIIQAKGYAAARTVRCGA